MHWTSAVLEANRLLRFLASPRSPTGQNSCWTNYRTPGGCWPSGVEGSCFEARNPDQWEPARDARGQLRYIADELKREQTKSVQVSKEPSGTKGRRVTAQISLAGRFLMYVPFASEVGVYRKIENREQRAKLREMVSKLVPKDSGG